MAKKKYCKEEQRRIYIRDIKSGNVDEFIVTEEIIDPDNTVVDYDKDGVFSLCKGCYFYKKCCGLNESEKDIKEEKEIFFKKEGTDLFPSLIGKTGDICNNLSYSKDYSIWKRKEVSKKQKSSYPILAKKLSETSYGDEEYEDLFSETIALSPTGLMEIFCKKTCPGYKKDFSCMKDLGCPFYKFFNDIYILL